MKLGVAQTRPVKGDIAANIEGHRRLLRLAEGVDVIVFPELSLTGYEPTLARELALDVDDPRLDVFQTISDAQRAIIGVGMPSRSAAAPRITLLLFRPRQPRLAYSKRYLHADEEPFFASGDADVHLEVDGAVLAPAICYELSVPAHADAAARTGASVYLASVAKTARGLETAVPRLAAIAREHAMTVLMANCIGDCDGDRCAGRTSIWNTRGDLMAQLDDREEGVLILDTATAAVAARRLSGGAS